MNVIDEAKCACHNNEFPPFSVFQLIERNKKEKEKTENMEQKTKAPSRIVKQKTVGERPIRLVALQWNSTTVWAQGLGLGLG